MSASTNLKPCLSQPPSHDAQLWGAATTALWAIAHRAVVSVVNTPDRSSVEGHISKGLKEGETKDPCRVMKISAEGSGGFYEHVTLLNPPGI